MVVYCRALLHFDAGKAKSLTFGATRMRVSGSLGPAEARIDRGMGERE